VAVTGSVLTANLHGPLQSGCLQAEFPLTATDDGVTSR
jgi:hypothetical protein